MILDLNSDKNNYYVTGNVVYFDSYFPKEQLWFDFGHVFLFLLNDTTTDDTTTTPKHNGPPPTLNIKKYQVDDQGVLPFYEYRICHKTVLRDISAKGFPGWDHRAQGELYWLPNNNVTEKLAHEHCRHNFSHYPGKKPNKYKKLSLRNMKLKSLTTIIFKCKNDWLKIKSMMGDTNADA